MKSDALAGVAAHPHAATMCFDDGATDVQPQAHAFAFRGEERRKEVCFELRIDPAARIRDLYFDEIAAIRPRAYGQLALAVTGFLHRFDRVAREIQDHLFHEQWIRMNVRHESR